MAIVSTSAGKHSITVSVTGLPNYGGQYAYNLRCEGGSDWGITSSGATSCSGTITGLSAGTTYNVDIFVERYPSASVIPVNETREVQTLSEPIVTPSESIGVTNIGETSATIVVYNSVPGQKYRFFWRLADVQESTPSPDITATGSTLSYSIGGLTPNTRYAVNVGKVINGEVGDNLIAKPAKEFTTLKSSRPASWSWTAAERNAFNNNGETTTLTQSRWNAFIANVNAVAGYKGVAALSGVDMGDDKILYATDWNQVVNKVSSLSGSSLSSLKNKSPGDSILGSYFIDLENAINSVK